MGIGMWELLIILAIVLVVFGAKKLRNLGGDVGGAIKNFKQAIKDEEGKTDGGAEDSESHKIDDTQEGRVIDGKVVAKKKHPA